MNLLLAETLRRQIASAKEREGEIADNRQRIHELNVERSRLVGEALAISRRLDENAQEKRGLLKRNAQIEPIITSAELEAQLAELEGEGQ
jgi:hypothetical protein